MTDPVDPELAATLPALFIVGAPRCGTTSLAGALAQHSRIAFSTPKEPHFFTSLRDPIDPGETRRHYLDRFFPHLSPAHRAIGEGSVSTIYDMAAVERILACFPQARFVAMIRNPLDMLPSYHGRVLFLLDEDQADFRKAWNLQRERAEGRKLPRECRDPNLLRYADIGRMGAALEKLFATAGRERCHVVVYDDYVRDGAGVLTEVLSLVDLRPEPGKAVRRRNVNRTYRYRWLQRLLRRPNDAMANVMVRAKEAKAARRKPSVTARTIQKVKRWNVVAAPRRPLQPDFRAELAETFREDVALLSRLVGRDLSPWLEGRPIAPAAAAAPTPAQA